MSKARRRTFRCGCCGADFLSTAVDQAKHDQDAGYGICERCVDWIAGKDAKRLAKMESTLADALNPENRAKFLAMDDGMRRAMVGEALEAGVMTFEVRA